MIASSIQPTKENILFLVRSYNEGTRIGPVLDGILQAGFSRILVVDDGSKDNTQTIVRARKTVIYLRHSFNRGPGAALETGFEFVRQHGDELGIQYVVTFDADGQHDIRDISLFMEAFSHTPGIDIVFGSRFLRPADTAQIPFLRKCILRGGKLFTRFISGIDLTDSHNGYRMFRIEAVKRIQLEMDWFEYASELVEQIEKHKFRFTEVPVNIIYDDYTLGKGQKSSNAINIAIHMIWKKLF